MCKRHDGAIAEALNEAIARFEKVISAAQAIDTSPQGLDNAGARLQASEQVGAVAVGGACLCGSQGGGGPLLVRHSASEPECRHGGRRSGSCCLVAHRATAIAVVHGDIAVSSVGRHFEIVTSSLEREGRSVV